MSLFYEPPIRRNQGRLMLRLETVCSRTTARGQFVTLAQVVSPLDYNLRKRLERSNWTCEEFPIRRRTARPVQRENIISGPSINRIRTGLILQTSRNMLFSKLTGLIREAEVMDRAQLGIPTRRKPSDRQLVFSPRNIEQVRAARLQLPGLSGRLNRLRERSPNRQMARIVDRSNSLIDDQVVRPLPCGSRRAFLQVRRLDSPWYAEWTETLMCRARGAVRRQSSLEPYLYPEVDDIDMVLAVSLDGLFVSAAREHLCRSKHLGDPV